MKKQVNQLEIKAKLLKNMLWLKHKLPYNGDWLFVSCTPETEEKKDDIASEYDKPDTIFKTLNSVNIDLARLTYERAKEYESFIYSSADHIRDKAKTLLNTASFTSAVLVIVLSFFLTTINSFDRWLIIIESILISFLAAHLIRALVTANEVMTREEFIKQSPKEFLSISTVDQNYCVKTYNKYTSEIVAYANQTHEFIRRRGNRLILAQTAFRYGLIYFVVIFIIHLTFTSWNKPKDPWTKLVELEEEIATISTINTEKNAKAIDELTEEVANLRKTSEMATQHLEELGKTIKQLENRLAEKNNQKQQ